MKSPWDISVSVMPIGGRWQTRKYKRLDHARRFAQKHAGRHPGLQASHAISNNGQVQVRCKGCLLAHLFPAASRGAQCFCENPQAEEAICIFCGGNADADDAFLTALEESLGLLDDE